MSNFPHVDFQVGSLSDGTPVRDKVKGKSHLADHPEVVPHLGTALKEISVSDFDQRRSCVRVVELPIDLETEVVEVGEDAECFFSLRPGRGVGRFGTEQFSARPSRFAKDASPTTTRFLKIVLWLKPADEEEDQVVVVTTAFPGNAEPEPWSYGLTPEAHERAVSYWKRHAFAGSTAADLESAEEGLYWQRTPAERT